jgi:glycosyltransferase involved in cell wall biosynthesis
MTEKIPITVFVGSYLSYSETFIYDQLRFQDRFEAHVCAYRKDKANQRFPYKNVTALNFIENLIYYNLNHSPVFDNTIKKSESTMIHAHFGTNGTLATGFAKRHKLPLAVTFHGHDVGGLSAEAKHSIRYGRYQKKVPEMFKQAGLLLPASTDLADRLISYGAPSEKIRVHRLGIDLNRFEPIRRNHGPLRVLCIGRFVPKKGFLYALGAFRRLHSENPEVRLTMVGAGPQIHAYKRYIKEHPGLRDAVHFAGVMTQDELKTLYASHDVLLAPSVTGSHGDVESGLLVLKEAAAMEMPGIGSRHGGIPEIIDHELSGFLAEEKDEVRLYHYLRELDRNYTLRVAMGKRARSLVEIRYNAIEQNHKLENHFIDLLNQ